MNTKSSQTRKQDLFTQ